MTLDSFVGIVAPNAKQNDNMHYCIAEQEVKVIWQKTPHGGPFPG